MLHEKSGHELDSWPKNAEPWATTSKLPYKFSDTDRGQTEVSFGLKTLLPYRFFLLLCVFPHQKIFAFQFVLLFLSLISVRWYRGIPVSLARQLSSNWSILLTFNGLPSLRYGIDKSRKYRQALCLHAKLKRLAQGNARCARGANLGAPSFDSVMDHHIENVSGRWFVDGIWGILSSNCYFSCADPKCPFSLKVSTVKADGAKKSSALRELFWVSLSRRRRKVEDTGKEGNKENNFSGLQVAAQSRKCRLLGLVGSVVTTRADHVVVWKETTAWHREGQGIRHETPRRGSDANQKRQWRYRVFEVDL